MTEERPKEPEIKVSQDGINTNFSLSPRIDQAPARPVGSVLRRSHHHHNRNHSIDTKDRTSPILGFGPLQSHDRLWSAADLGASDHPVAPSDATPSISLSSLEPGRALNGSYDPASGFSASRSKPVSAALSVGARKISGGSAGSSSSSSSSTGSASPEATISSDSRRPHARTADRFQVNGTNHHFSEGSTRRTASPARSFPGAPISPRLQSTMSAHAGLAHARRTSADLSPVPFRAPSPIFLPSTSPPAGTVNPDSQHSWDSVWPRSSTPDRADQLRRIGSISPVAGSPGRSSPSTLSDSVNLSHSPSASFESSSPLAASNTILGRPQPRRPHELRGSSSSPILRISPAALRDSHDPAKSPRRSLETARSEPVVKIGFNPPPASADAPTIQTPANRVLSPATEAVPHVDAANALASHRSGGASQSWAQERAESPSATFASDPRKRTGSGSGPMMQGLPLPPRTPSPKMSPTSPRSPFLELAGASTAGPSSSNMGLSESPPKTRSFIAMPPRSGYELSDDPDDVGSEEDGSNSERESVGTNDEDLEGSEYDDDDGITDADAIDEDTEHTPDHDARQKSEDDNDQESQISDVVPERPTLPKRPSLTRSGVVPPPITVLDHVRSPMDPLAQAESSARALAAQKGSTGSAMLNFFRDEPSAQEAQQLAMASDVDAVMPSALGLDAGDAQPLDAAMDEGLGGGGGGGEDNEDEDEDDQGFGMGPEHAEDSLNTLERIFLFAKSDMAYHRVLVSQSLPEWIREVELSDAVEYIIPLLNGLATDELDVCAAFAPEIGRVMWFFFRNCPIAELADESSEMQQNGDDAQPEKASRPRISLAAFTTLLCALLLNQNTIIAGATQQSLVHLFYRLDRRDLELSKEELAEKSDQEVKARQQEQDLESYVTHASGRDGQPVPHEEYHFDDQARAAVKTELLENVALALAHINHGRGDAEAKADESAPLEHGAADSHVQKDAAGEAMDEDAAGESESVEAVNGSGEADESNSDAMEEEHESRDSAASWSQGGHMFGNDSDGSASDVQIDEDEESAVARMASVSLLSALAADELIPQEALIGRFAPEVLKLIDDGAFYVRKEVASSLGPLSRNMSTETVKQTVLGALHKAIHDRNWHVRQAACFSLPAVLGKLDEELRREQTLVMMRALVNDVSSHLRMAALEIIGEVIYMFHGTAVGVPEELVRFFLGEPFDGPPQQGDASLTFDKTSDPEGTEALFEEESAMMMDEAGSELGVGVSSRAEHDALLASFGYGQEGQESSMMDAAPWEQNFRGNNFDPERPLVVAYNLPAVVLTLGAEQWSRLKQAHAELTQSDKPKVRKSLAASLHEIAKIVGKEATRDDLLPAATRFVTDEEAEVRTAMFENMDVLLTCVPQAEAEKMLWQMVSLWSSGSLRDWRLRERLALHIPSMAKQFLLSDEEGNLVSLMQLALADPISAVRDAGVVCVPNLYRAFAEHDQVIADGFLGMVSDLGDSVGYRLRVACLLCIGALVEAGMQRSSCELLLLGRLSAMGEDGVVDVRIALARTLGQMCRKEELYASGQSRSKELNRLIAKLAHDESDEVQQPVSGILSNEEVARYAPQPTSEERTRRKLVLGPADGGPHRPSGESGSMSQFVDAEGDEGDAHVFRMDDDEESGSVDAPASGAGEQEAASSGESGQGEAEGTTTASVSQSAQHLEMSRASIFGGVQRQAESGFGSDWVNHNRAALFDYGENEEEDEDESDDDDDDDGIEEDGIDEPHHLLNVDRDSSGSGELIEHETLNEDEGEACERNAAGEDTQAEAQNADDSMMEEEESAADHGLTLSSPQRVLEGDGKGGEGGAGESPSRVGGTTAAAAAAAKAAATSGGGSKAADPFLAFVAGRRSQDLPRLQTGGGRVGGMENASKRSRLANGSAGPERALAESGAQDGEEGEMLQSPNGDDEMMGTRFHSKNSGDWSQLSGIVAPTTNESRGSTPEGGGEDDFVRV
ncbi:uncharacterized protein PSANT_05972 [Moesziomyces antarcticus]|nr:uncharacterized protein PSANT_05972 [Moesziomyces antarcticus]